MTKKHTYFRPTTAQQRRLLFETWETTGEVETACQQAHVCQATFYYWKPRFEAGGYAALEKAESHAPKSPHQTSARIEQQVVAMRQEHSTWGKERIADELAKANNWQRVISPNTVRRILMAAGHWSQPPTAPPKKLGRANRPHGRNPRSDGECGPVFCACQSRNRSQTSRGQRLIGSLGGGKKCV